MAFVGLTKSHLIIHTLKVLKKYHLAALMIPFMGLSLILSLLPPYGNAFVIIGRVRKALLKAGADKEYVDKYQEASMAGDHDNLLCVSMKYVDVT